MVGGVLSGGLTDDCFSFPAAHKLVSGSDSDINNSLEQHTNKYEHDSAVSSAVLKMLRAGSHDDVDSTRHMSDVYNTRHMSDVDSTFDDLSTVCQGPHNFDSSGRFLVKRPVLPTTNKLNSLAAAATGNNPSLGETSSPIHCEPGETSSLIGQSISSVGSSRTHDGGEGHNATDQSPLRQPGVSNQNGPQTSNCLLDDPSEFGC